MAICLADAPIESSCLAVKSHYTRFRIVRTAAIQGKLPAKLNLPHFTAKVSAVSYGQRWNWQTTTDGRRILPAQRRCSRDSAAVCSNCMQWFDYSLRQLLFHLCSFHRVQSSSKEAPQLISTTIHLSPDQSATKSHLAAKRRFVPSADQIPLHAAVTWSRPCSRLITSRGQTFRSHHRAAAPTAPPVCHPPGSTHWAPKCSECFSS